jgi:hypothetical protein
MKIDDLEKGARLVTQYGDIVELIEVEQGGLSAKVRYLEVLGSDATENTEASIPSDDIATHDGDRFIGPT